MMRLSAFTISLLAPVIASAAGIELMDCGSRDDVATIRELSIEPNPPVLGRNASIIIDTNISKPINEGAYGTTKVQLTGALVSTWSYDVCSDILAMNGLDCPVEPGQYTIKIPISIPEADVLDPDRNTKYIMHSEASLEDGDGLGCVEVEVRP